MRRLKRQAPIEPLSGHTSFTRNALARPRAAEASGAHSFAAKAALPLPSPFGLCSIPIARASARLRPHFGKN